MKSILLRPFRGDAAASAAAPDLTEQLQAEDRADQAMLLLIVCTALALLALSLAAVLQST